AATKPRTRPCTHSRTHNRTHNATAHTPQQPPPPTKPPLDSATFPPYAPASRRPPHRQVMPMGQPTTYVKIGGGLTVARLCDSVLGLMAETPQFAELRALHPEDLQGSRDNLFMFLSGWLGGPDLFVQQFGHPRLRA